MSGLHLCKAVYVSKIQSSKACALSAHNPLQAGAVVAAENRERAEREDQLVAARQVTLKAEEEVRVTYSHLPACCSLD
jgi:hypothetical protein